MAKLKLAERVVEFLQQNPEQRFTARELAVWFFKTYPEECQAKKEASKATVIPINTDAALVTEITSNISSMAKQFRKKGIKRIERGRIYQYYYTEKSDEQEISQQEITPSSPTEGQTKLQEKDLYPMLATFLLEELNVHSMRIDEGRSSNTHGKHGNKWLHPDMVGMEDLTQDWESQEIKDCFKVSPDKKTKLWSVEVKLKINRSNVREVFFQAVSNSTWANFGYLVAAEIEGAMKELRLLAGLHKIGFIRLNVEDPLESEVVIPAPEREEIDWDTMNRIAAENKDFAKYIKKLRQFYQTGDIQL